MSLFNKKKAPHKPAERPVNTRKNLIINGVKYAVYEINETTKILYLHVFYDNNPNTLKGQFENNIIQIIQFVENRKVSGAAYLNI